VIDEIVMGISGVEARCSLLRRSEKKSGDLENKRRGWMLRHFGKYRKEAACNRAVFFLSSYGSEIQVKWHGDSMVEVPMAVI
jgi:hypothetical protein